MWYYWTRVPKCIFLSVIVFQTFDIAGSTCSCPDQRCMVKDTERGRCECCVYVFLGKRSSPPLDNLNYLPARPQNHLYRVSPENIRRLFPIPLRMSEGKASHLYSEGASQDMLKDSYPTNRMSAYLYENRPQFPLEIFLQRQTRQGSESDLYPNGESV